MPDDDNNSSHRDRPREDGDAETQHYSRRAKEHTVAGAAFGVASAGAFAVFGTLACPLCAVAAPLLVGSGAWNAHKAKKCDDDNQQDCPPGPRVGERIEFSS